MRKTAWFEDQTTSERDDWVEEDVRTDEQANKHANCYNILMTDWRQVWCGDRRTD